MAITIKYETGAGKLCDSLPAAQLYESLDSDPSIFVDSYKLKVIIERIMRDFEITKKDETPDETL